MTESFANDQEDTGHSVTDEDTAARHAEYWRRNTRLLGALLVVWFVVSYLCGIVFAEALNTFTLPFSNFPLGFWFAQQGSIYTFVALIFWYSWQMNKLDKKYEADGEGEGE